MRHTAVLTRPATVPAPVLHDVTLDRRDLWSLCPSQGTLELRVLSGVAYLTEEGLEKDYFLRPGDHLPLLAHRRVVVQGYPTAHCEVVEG